MDYLFPMLVSGFCKMKLLDFLAPRKRKYHDEIRSPQMNYFWGGSNPQLELTLQRYLKCHQVIVLMQESALWLFASA